MIGFFGLGKLIFVCVLVGVVFVLKGVVCFDGVEFG